MRTHARVLTGVVGLLQLLALALGASAAIGAGDATQRSTEQARPLMRDFVGLNGHTVQFKPELYRPVCRLVRDYHPVEWDLGKATEELPPFPFARNRVDWSRVYGSWRERGWTIDASLMFETIDQTNWADIGKDARAYGRAFAREFGPAGQRKLVDAVEIGNEPGKWSDADYSRMFQAMAQGIREGDPALKIATCNLTTGKSGDYEKNVGCVQQFPELFDILNVHSYAQLDGWPTWRRSFPEDPRLRAYLPDVEALCRWRDAHARGKPIWITEFGYDSSTKLPEKGGDAAQWIGVTDQQQAQWLVRSVLVFSTLPVARAYVYFFNDDNQPGVHASAGITRRFQPKPSFHALAQLQKVLGDFRFHRIVMNQTTPLRIQEYRNDSKQIVWVVWSPTGEGRRLSVALDGTPGRVISAQRMLLTPDSDRAPEIAIPKQERNGDVGVLVDESPLYLVFERP